MKPILFVLFLLAVPPQTDRAHLPATGDELLESCNLVVEGMDNPASVNALGQKDFVVAMGKFNWCAGYLQALQYANFRDHIHITVIAQMKVTLTGDEKSKEAAFEMLSGSCVPDKASVGQLARVVVKFRRDHPEKLHEQPGGLVDESFINAFPCEAKSPS